MVQADRCGSLWHSVQRNLERRAETAATALRFNSAMVKIDETFGNRESETKSAELSASQKDQPAQMAETTKPTAAAQFQSRCR